MDEQRKKLICDGLQKIREKRKYQICRVFELKIDDSRLNIYQRNFLKMLFVEAKWFYNFILSQKDPFKYDYKKVDITSLDKEGNKVKRNISHLGSSIRVSLIQQIQESIIALNHAKKKGIKVGKLHFKSDFVTIALKNDAFSVQKNGTVRLQKIKKPFVVHGLKQLPKDAELANAKLIKKPSGYYIKVTTYSIPIEIENREKKDVGIDFGIRSNVTTSDKEKFNWSIGETERLKHIQRKIAKCKKGSNNRRKLLLLIEKEYEKISNRKNDAANKFCHYLLSKYRIIYIQNDNLAEWKKKKNNRNSSIQHSLLGRIKRRLSESKQVVVIERFAPSTKQCYKCGAINEVKRSDVLFECKGCGHKEDRDVKAAKTIMLFGKIASLDFVPTDHRAKLVEIGTSTSDAFEHLKQVSVVEARRLDAKASS